ncbi:hypothetical protein A7U60_g3404 [Sanghuangporus baumii]|uniref:Hyaluronan/mRNA-binding protein domain-containing protein n=1 Tax=Sanghuangporus baumii TaxID=108892 RepID=A0A9Q5I0H4_SANBA|nr:hypothetical protein A7U60_g3404 [Sanghuangporus baumii]
MSRSGYDKSLRKGGAGQHNWGSVRDELELEREALEDAEIDEGELAETSLDVNAAVRPVADGPPTERPSSPLSPEEVEKARKLRAKGLKEDVNLASIARTSAAVSTSPKAPSLEITRDADTRSIP